MKSHILSHYAEKIGSRRNDVLEPTVATEVSGEATDVDEFHASAGPTRLTETMESTDTDEFHMKHDPTKSTFTIESSDEDYFASVFAYV